MTVASSINKTRFLGSNSAGPFPFGFKFYQNEEIIVVHVDSEGTEAVFAEGTNYTLTGAGLETGGIINLSAILATGEELVVNRVLDIIQETAFINQGAFYPVLHEVAYDKLTMMLQQIAEETGRAIKMPVSHTGPFTMPGINRANTLVGFDADGNPELKTASYSITMSQVIGSVSILDADNSAGPVTVNLPADGEVLITVTGDTGNDVTLATLDESTILRGAGYVMSGYDEFVRLMKVGTNWRKC